MLDALPNHWPKYLRDAAGLRIFTVSAGHFKTLFEYPGSSVHHAISSVLLHYLGHATDRLRFWQKF